ncbi:hypothetical protein P153DRAFT_382934 [Dothidotthia symphoricarpi CBS 119687]|uniref:Uncharacterized protein n=1 Tax=Dothidotthia symphoricarpi CBS 119687 TaxID=1392245 RepID=A0A6A6AJ87_9PLEO|nr:uncharacterized protein P153DRAFT_382934 [Dothidotthia symphoricarpi CBS 119687]KAF2132042.1 hypothetical protein P153DRAFT_382934 [Dothidotthia symphoricarpi CBS 119687]
MKPLTPLILYTLSTTTNPTINVSSKTPTFITSIVTATTPQTSVHTISNTPAPPNKETNSIIPGTLLNSHNEPKPPELFPGNTCIYTTLPLPAHTLTEFCANVYAKKPYRGRLGVQILGRETDVLVSEENAVDVCGRSADSGLTDEESEGGDGEVYIGFHVPWPVVEEQEHKGEPWVEGCAYPVMLLVSREDAVGVCCADIEGATHVVELSVRMQAATTTQNLCLASLAGRSCFSSVLSTTMMAHPSTTRQHFPLPTLPSTPVQKYSSPTTPAAQGDDDQHLTSSTSTSTEEQSSSQEKHVSVVWGRVTHTPMAWTVYLGWVMFGMQIVGGMWQFGRHLRGDWRVGRWFVL